MHKNILKQFCITACRFLVLFKFYLLELITISCLQEALRYMMKSLLKGFRSCEILGFLFAFYYSSLL